jgi:hypothetical protein
MPISILFWVLFVLWVAFGAINAYRNDARLTSATVVVGIVLLALLGWAVYGPLVR